MLAARDWYREVTAKIITDGSDPDKALNADLIVYFIRIQALLLLPVAPHVAEHLWTTLLGEAKSVQLALFPEPSKPVDQAIIDSAAYGRDVIKIIRDAELAVNKRKAKGKQVDTTFDPAKPKALSVFVAKSYPEWQDKCMIVAQEAYDPESKTLVRSKVVELLNKEGLIKDKKAMPFIMNIQVLSPLYYTSTELTWYATDEHRRSRFRGSFQQSAAV